MLGAVLLAATCLDVFGASRTAYSVRLGDRTWGCGDDGEVAAGGRDLVWYRVDDRAAVLSDPEDIEEVLAVFRPIRERDEQLDALREKREGCASQQRALTDEVRRLTEKRGRYAAGSEKNRAVTDELDAAEARLRRIVGTLSQLDAQDDALRDENRRDLDRARVRLSLIVERALLD